MNSCASSNKLKTGFGGKWDGKTEFIGGNKTEDCKTNTVSENQVQPMIQREVASAGFNSEAVQKEQGNSFFHGSAKAHSVLNQIPNSDSKRKEISAFRINKQQPNTSNENPPQGKKQLTALLLCLFLGNFGVHRFYLGYPLIGILQILTLGGLGIWSLIDLIFIITGDLKPKNGEYVETLQGLKKKEDKPTQI